MDTKPKIYRAGVDIDWREGGKRVRLEAGQTSAAIPAQNIPWLLRCGAIVEVSGNDR